VAGIVGSSGAGLKVIVVERLLAVLRTLLASPFLEDRAPNSSGMARVAEAVERTDRTLLAWLLIEFLREAEARTGMTTAPAPSPARLNTGAG
jgi:hypothetical protein